MKAPMSPRAMQKKCDCFNARFPIGTLMFAWTGEKKGPGRVGQVRARAEILSGHTPIVWLAGIRGCIALSHVEPVR